MFDNPVFCALDTADVTSAAALGGTLAGVAGGLKIGMELFYAGGGDGYRRIAAAGLPVFLDLKLHDIPNTVAAGIRALLPLRPAIINVHAAGGSAMMAAAAGAAKEAGSGSRPWVIAVTVLTSLDGDDLAAAGVTASPRDQAVRLAALARNAGLDGVVCSGHEIAAIRAECGADFRLIVPGLRPAGAAAGDQKRVMTPRQARELGADVLVIGRPITAAPDPARAAREIVSGLGAGCGQMN